MTPAKFRLDEAQLQFLERYKELGFKDKSTLVRAALDRLQKEIEQKQLQESADLYAEIYGAEEEQLTEAALDGWPE